MKRIISLALCAVLVLGLFAGASIPRAKAAEGWKYGLNGAMGWNEDTFYTISKRTTNNNWRQALASANGEIAFMESGDPNEDVFIFNNTKIVYDDNGVHEAPVLADIIDEQRAGAINYNRWVWNQAANSYDQQTYGISGGRLAALGIARIDENILPLLQRMIDRGHTAAADSGFHQDQCPAQPHNNTVPYRKMPAQRLFTRCVFTDDQSVPGQNVVMENPVICRINAVQAVPDHRDCQPFPIQASPVCGGVNAAGQSADDGYALSAQVFRQFTCGFLSCIGSGSAAHNGQGSVPEAVHVSLQEQDGGRIMDFMQ